MGVYKNLKFLPLISPKFPHGKLTKKKKMILTLLPEKCDKWNTTKSCKKKKQK